MWVDSHCHLDFPDFAAELDAVIGRARAANVGAMLTISTHISRIAAVTALASRYDNLWCSAGVHPHEAANEALESEDMLIQAGRHPKAVGIGETGLDYFYEHSPRQEQQTAFRHHITAARRLQLPLIVHARDADEDVIAILRDEFKKGPFPGLIHCFTSGEALAACALELGFMISFSGIITFKSAAPLREIVKTVPLERLLVETDAPYLSPNPHRGKRNEPAFVVHTAAEVAKLKDVPLATLEAATTQNFFRLFTKAVPAA